MLTRPSVPPAGTSLEGIQALRFVAAMLVVATHAAESLSSHGADMQQWRAGAVGVDIFFVISGFVMAWITPSLRQGWPARSAAAAMFLKRRLVRLLPLYWFYTALKVLLLLLFPALAIRASLEPFHVVALFLLLPAMAPWGLVEPIVPAGWTLCLEMFFYGIFTLAILLGAPRLIFCLAFFIVIALLKHVFPSSLLLDFYHQALVYDFAVGIFVAWIIRKSVRLHPLWAATGLVAGFYVLLGMEWAGRAEASIYFCVAAGVVVWGVAALEPVWQRLPILPWLKHLGDASYSTYLSHGFVIPVVVLLTANILPAEWVLVLAIFASAGAGSLSYRFIERRMTDFFRKKILRSHAPRLGAE